MLPKALLTCGLLAAATAPAVAIFHGYDNETAAPLSSRRALQTACDLTKEARAAMKACCGAHGGGGHRRTLQTCNLPHTCPSAGCALHFTTFYQRCESTLRAMRGININQYHALMASCQSLGSSAGGPKNPVSGGSSEFIAFDNRHQCNVDQRMDSDIMKMSIRQIRVITVDGSSYTYPVPVTTLQALMGGPWHGVAGEDDRYKLLVESPMHDINQNLYLFMDGDAVDYSKGKCRRAKMRGKKQSDCPGTPYGLISLTNPGKRTSSYKAKLTADYGTCYYRPDWGFVVRAMFVTSAGTPPPPPVRTALDITLFDNDHSCAVNQRIPDKYLDRHISRIGVKTVGGKTHEWNVGMYEGSLRKLLQQDWKGVAGQNDVYKLLAGDSRKKEQNLYMFMDGDAVNYAGDATCPEAKVNMGHIKAVDGVNSKVAGGEAVTRSGGISYIHFPNSKSGNFGKGYIRYNFQCTAATTVSFKSEIVAPNGGDDSMFIAVDLPKGATTANPQCAINIHSPECVKGDHVWHTGQGGDLLQEDFDESRESPSFRVSAGKHSMYISEREDGIAIESFTIVKGAGICTFGTLGPGGSAPQNKCPGTPLGLISMGPPPRYSHSLTIDATEGVDSFAANGEAVMNTNGVKYVKFPNSRSGNEGKGYIRYSFTCNSPATISFTAKIVALNGKDDSMYVSVDLPPGAKAATNTWHTGQGGSLHPLTFKKSTSSPNFHVSRGSHGLYISEREDGIIFSSFTIALGAHSCKFKQGVKFSGDYGTCSYRNDWPWLIRKMWVTPKDLPGGERYRGCYQDCGTRQGQGAGTMNRVCDVAKGQSVSSETSPANCHKRCQKGGFKLMAMACPMTKHFECWCCNALDADDGGGEGLLPEEECRGGKLTSGLKIGVGKNKFETNTNTHCLGFDTDTSMPGVQGKYSMDGYALGGACRAAVYDVVAPKPVDLSFQGCYQDCGTTSDGEKVNRVCDDKRAIQVTSVEDCQAQCQGYTYMAMACPMPKGFECWCCNTLDKDNKAGSALIDERECSAKDHKGKNSQFTSGLTGNRNGHCSGLRVGSTFEEGGYKLGGYALGGACRAAVYNMVAPANLALHKPTAASSDQGVPGAYSRKAVDGNTFSTKSRWLSKPTANPHWIAVDLLRPYSVQRVKIFAGCCANTAGGKKVQRYDLCSHQVQKWNVNFPIPRTPAGSVDLAAAGRNNAAWVTLAQHGEQTHELEHLNFHPQTTQLVRLYIDQSACVKAKTGDYYARVYEFEVYGEPVNTWNSITEISNGQKFAHMRFQGKDWYLVRRAHDPKGGWHPVNDNAAGTTVYGNYDPNPRGRHTFSVAYANFAYQNMLLASGDRRMWVTLTRQTVETFGKINCNNCVLPLTGSSRPHQIKTARQYMRQASPEDPWISAGNHPDYIVYGENGNKGHNKDDALNFGGANVWVDAFQ